jgi:hypothetical protein
LNEISSEVSTAAVRLEGRGATAIEAGTLLGASVTGMRHQTVEPRAMWTDADDIENEKTPHRLIVIRYSCHDVWDVQSWTLKRGMRQDQFDGTCAMQTQPDYGTSPTALCRWCMRLE